VVAALSILSLAAYRRLPSRSLASSPPAGLEHSANPGAKELYLQGLYHWNKRTAADLNQALGEFNQSIARDPNYAPAYVGLANCYNLLREYSLMPSSEAYPRAIAAAQRAIALDDSLAEAHNSLAFGDFYWLWDAAGAEYQFRRSIVLNANSALAHHWYATFLMVLARFDESLAEIEKARALDPTSSAILADKGLVLYAAGRPNEAIALLQGLEKSEPDFLSPHAYLGTVYLEMRNFKGYLPEAKRSALLLKDKDRLAVVTAGEKGFATGAGAGMLRQMLRVQQSLYLQDKISAYELATTYSLLGDRQHALDLLQISVQKREARDVALRIDQNFDGLHDQPAFRTLLAKVGLPPLS
jgi:tetratricopeptide (TPR) repeat protein